MSFIKVPIGRGIVGQVQQEQREKSPESQAQTTLEFLKRLADQGKLRNNQEQLVGAADMDVVIPEGTTFYLLQAFGGITASTSSLRLRTVIGGVVTTLKTQSGTSPDSVDVTISGLSFRGNGVDLIRLSSTGGTISVNLEGYLENTPSSRAGISSI